MKFDGPFVPGTFVHGLIVGTQVNPDVAKRQKEYHVTPCDITVERVEPQNLFSFRWHPYAVDPAYDYSNEPSTLVEFTLQDVAEGILLTVVESGFDRIPLARRAIAFNANENGWAIVITLIRDYLAQKSQAAH